METMAAAPHERTGVLVIRVWAEGDPLSLRMRVTRTLDVEAREDVSDVTSSVDEVVAIVRSWLDDLRPR